MNEKLKVLIPYLASSKMTLNIQQPPLLHQSGNFMLQRNILPLSSGSKRNLTVSKQNKPSIEKRLMDRG
jgi:hypothetical protein